LSRTLNDVVSLIRSGALKFIKVEIGGCETFAISIVKNEEGSMTIEPIAIVVNDDIFALIKPDLGDIKFTVEGFTKQ